MFINNNCKNCFDNLPMNVSKCDIKKVSKGGISRLLFLKCDSVNCSSLDWNSYQVWENLINQCKIYLSSKGLGSKSNENIKGQTSFCNVEETLNQKHLINFKVYYDISDKVSIHSFYYQLYKTQKDYLFGYLSCENDFQGWFNFRMEFNHVIDDNNTDGLQYFDINIEFYKNGILPPSNLPSGVFDLLLNQNCGGGGGGNCSTDWCWTDEFNNEFISVTITYPNITLPTLSEINNNEKVEMGIGFGCSDAGIFLGAKPYHSAVRQTEGFYATIEDLIDALVADIISAGILNSAQRIGTSLIFTMEQSSLEYWMDCDPCTNFSVLSGLIEIQPGIIFQLNGYNSIALNFSSYTFVNGDEYCLVHDPCIVLNANALCLTYNSLLYLTIDDFLNAFGNQIATLNAGILYNVFGGNLILNIPLSYYNPIDPNCQCPNLGSLLVGGYINILKNGGSQVNNYYQCNAEKFIVDYITPVSVCASPVPLPPDY